MNRGLVGLSVLLVVAGCLARLVHLDADPDYYSWIGAYIDEGRWTAVARSFALDGRIIVNPRNHNFFVAPAFEAVSSLSFLGAGGVSLWAARIFPALCGCAILVLLFVYFRRYATPLGLVAGLSVVALQEDLVSLSRVAIPETTAMLGALLAWVALDAARERRAWLAGAGLLLVVTLAFKMTSFVLIPGFVLIAWAQRSGAPTSERIRDAAAFVSGFAIPGLVGLLGAVLVLPDPGAIVARLSRLAHFLAIQAPFGMFERHISANVAPGMNVGMLGLWLGTLVLLAPNPASSALAEASIEPVGTRRRLRSAWLWALTWILALTLQVYFPERYRVQLFLPIALVVAFAVTRLESIGAAGLAQAFRDAQRNERFRLGVVLALPWILWMAAGFAAILLALGFDEDRLVFKLGAMGLACGPALLLVMRLAVSTSGMSKLIAIPLVATPAWLLVWAWTPDGFSFWPHAEEGAFNFLLLRTALVGISTLLVTGFLRFTPGQAKRKAIQFPAGVVLASAVWTSAWLAFVLPDALDPKYTQREAGRDLAERLADRDEVHQFHADALFLANRIRFDLANAHLFAEQLPQVVVTGVPFDGDDADLEAHYALVTNYGLHTSSRYGWPKPYAGDAVCGPARVYCVGVYERTDASNRAGKSPDANGER